MSWRTLPAIAALATAMALPAGVIWLAGIAGPALAASPGGAASVAPPGAASCSGCHGLSPGASVGPPIAGMPERDIADAMAAFRAGQRPATVMDRIAKGFDPAETQAIAAWLAGVK
jgi:sulfide dehydrogenase cytochrome subunit